MRTIISLTAVFAASAALAQEAYRWVDESGITHYSDRPEEGAEQIQLPENARPIRRFAPAPSTTPPADEDGTAAVTAEPFSYDSIEIGTPAAEETLWNIEGVLNVTLNLQPALQPGHRVRVYFDGNEQMVSGSSFQIQEVYRGVHNLQAEVLDETGKLMGRSLPNRFYVQQNTIVRN